MPRQWCNDVPQVITESFSIETLDDAGRWMVKCKKCGIHLVPDTMMSDLMKHLGVCGNPTAARVMCY